MAEDLSAPLLKRSERRRAARLGRRRWQFPFGRLAFACTGLLLVAAGLRIVLVDEPGGGRPIAERPIAPAPDPNPLASSVAPAPQSDMPLSRGPVSGPSIITLGPDGAATEVSSAASGALASATGALPDLLEETQHGPIPRIGPSGLRPFDAYRTPSEAPAGNAPRIAVIVTGLGLNEAGTLDAVRRLPAAVSLAFAPYGRSLEQSVATAHGEGHEIFLQVPLEPFDYPDNDPGPETLLTGQPPRENLEKLFWLLSRFSGYVGLINHMGARFTASGADFSPIMEELGTRGLGYLDDGSSNRSIAPQLAASNNVPFSRASLVLDANPAPAPIQAQLRALEAEARAKGFAIGVVSALPVSIETLAEWASTLEDRGLVLAPASALMQ